MSLLDWAAKSRHESANDPVIFAVHLACRGTASAGAGPPSPARMASPAAHTFRRVVVFARLMPNLLRERLPSLPGAQADGWTRQGTAEPKTSVGFGRVVTLD